MNHYQRGLKASASGNAWWKRATESQQGYNLNFVRFSFLLSPFQGFTFMHILLSLVVARCWCF